MRRLIRRYWKLGLLPCGLLLAWTLVGANAATPAADAAQAGDIPTIRTLIQQKADLNRAQADGMTALHWSASHNDVAMTQVLLRAGANPNTETRLGAITPLFVASRNGNAAIVEVLLKAGAKANAVDGTGATPLMFAAGSGSAEAVEVLVAHGAQVNAREVPHGQTALMFAAASNRGSTINALLKHGADAEVATLVADPGCGSLFAKSMGCGGGGDSDGEEGIDKPAPKAKGG